MGLKVFKECCNNCLLSEDRIVSPKRAKEIIKGCAEKQTQLSCLGAVSGCCSSSDKISKVYLLNQKDCVLENDEDEQCGTDYYLSVDGEVYYGETIIDIISDALNINNKDIF